MSASRIVVDASDAAFATAIRDLLAAQFAESSTETFDPAHLRTKPLADAIILDGRAAVAGAAALAARLRAMGFTGAVVVIADDIGGSGNALAAAGAAHAGSKTLASDLVSRLAEQLASAEGEFASQVMRARRLMAAGEIALGFQHSLNNPLAGILAEAQLLQLDELPPEQNEALDRIVALCRRIIELGKSLDGMSERK